MKHLIITVLFLAISIFAHAQMQYSPTQEYKEEGQMLSIRLVMGEPARIFVIGKEEAKLDLSDLKLTIRRLKPYPAREFVVNRKGNYFEVSEPKELSLSTDLQVTAKSSGKTETLKFKLKKLP